VGQLSLQAHGIVPSFAMAIRLIFTAIFLFLSWTFDFAVSAGVAHPVGS
jgi:hypothetical protein